jgi:hypothetical protein
MNTMVSLNVKQFNLLNDYVKSGRDESFVKKRISLFGVNPEDQAALYSQLLVVNKEVKITELDKEFSGLQICTENDPNKLMSDGFSGEWKLKLKRAEGCEYLQVFSLTDRGLYFIAKITGFKKLKNGKYQLFFTDAELQRHASKNLKFTRNVVRYINMPDKNAQNKNK